MRGGAGVDGLGATGVGGIPAGRPGVLRIPPSLRGPLAALLLSAALLLPGPARGAHFPAPPSFGPSATLSGTATADGLPLEPGDEVAAFSVHRAAGSATAWERVPVGRATVAAPGEPLSLSVAGDDPSTPSVVEGCVAGEEILLVLWRASEGREYWGATAPDGGPLSPAWPGDGATVLADVRFVPGQRIPLRPNAWNLVSFGVLSGYYDASKVPEPAVRQLAGVSWSPVPSLSEAAPLRSISGSYDRVTGNDGSGAKLFNPSLAAFATLHSLAPGYGYWVKTKASSRPVLWMTVPGEAVPQGASLPLEAGWTLAGNWSRPSLLHGPGSDPDSALLPPDATSRTPLGSSGDAWLSLGSSLERATGFDGGGAKIWNPSLPAFSTLRQVAPGQGYWVRLREAAVLRWYDFLPPPSLSAEGRDWSVALSWPSVAGASSYSVRGGPGASVDGTTPVVATVADNGALIPGLPSGVAHAFAVSARIGATETALSPAASAVPTGAAGSGPPSSVTLPAGPVTASSAVLNGTADPNGTACTVRFEWGTDPSLSAFDSTPELPAGSGGEPVPQSSLLPGLSPSTTYYYRCVASNAFGSSSGSIASFTTPGSCFGCHGGAEGEGKPRPGGGTPNGVNLQEYLWSGHGRTEGSYPGTGNPGAGFGDHTDGPSSGCHVCHSATAGHESKDPSDPYRLGSGLDASGQTGSVKGAFASDVDGLCLSCHGPEAERAGRPEAASGNYSVDAATHGHGASGDRYPSWPVTPWKCVDCHDPHGDGAPGADRLAMVRSYVNAPVSPSDGSAGSDVHGTPLRASGLTPVAFSGQSGMAAGSYASLPARGQGICEACHTQTSEFSRGGSGNGGSHGARTGRCTTCHVHKSSFRYTGADVGQYFDRAVRGADGRNLGEASSHPLAGLSGDTAGSLLFGFGVNCLSCHYGSGPSRTGDECLRCHFEGGYAPGTNHGDGTLQLASVPASGAAPAAPFPVATLADYDAWCLQCHGGSGIALGGRTPTRERRTLLDDNAWTRSRHRAQGGSAATGCITCHSPHGEGNGQLVRSEPAHRAGAGGRPGRFGVFPFDNLAAVPPAYGRSGVQRTSYRARTDNVATGGARAVFADADEDGDYCGLACHYTRRDRYFLRDGATGLYVLNPANRKLVIIAGVEYSVDNAYLAPSRHGHPSQDIIPTSDMAAWYAQVTGGSGGSLYRYPRLGGSDPAAATSGWNAGWFDGGRVTGALPFFPDFPDGERDFLQGYLDRGPIRYRYSCSTCHDPHGTPLPNGARLESGYPDLRLRKNSGSELCWSCH